MVPVFRASDVERAVSPHEAYDAVRDAFNAHARGEWTMPPKVYVANYPAGDFRAMPALGDGHALLKWVTSFPGNSVLGLPTVTGLVLLSDAEDGRLLTILDAAAVTALRTAAAGVLAAETLCRPEASSYAVIGCGVNGAETARMLVAQGVTPFVWEHHIPEATYEEFAVPNWPEEDVRDLLAQHLTLTKGEAVARLQQDWDADVAAFDDIFTEILTMADALTDGIVAQFPERFGGNGVHADGGRQQGSPVQAEPRSTGGKTRFRSSPGNG